MSNQNYTPFNIYQKRKMSESATPLKSIYAKNHNMFMNAVPEARSGMDRGFEQAGGEEKINLPSQNQGQKEKEKEDEKKKTNLVTTTTPDLSGGDKTN